MVRQVGRKPPHERTGNEATDGECRHPTPPRVRILHHPQNKKCMEKRKRTARLTTGRAEAAKWHRRQIAGVERQRESNLTGDEDARKARVEPGQQRE